MSVCPCVCLHAVSIISNHQFSVRLTSDLLSLSLSLPLPLDGLDDDEVVQRIRGVVKLKKKSLGGHDSPEALSKAMNRPMILIGG